MFWRMKKLNKKGMAWEYIIALIIGLVAFAFVVFFMIKMSQTDESAFVVIKDMFKWG